MRKLFFLILLLSASSSLCFGAEKDISLLVEASPKTITVGDPINYKATLERKPQIKILKPPQIRSENFEILKRSEPEIKIQKNLIREIYRFKLTAYEAGQKNIESLRVEYLDPSGKPNIVESREIPITVKSVLKNTDEKTDIRGAKGVVGIEPEYKKYFPILYGIGGFCGVTPLPSH